MVLVWVGTDIGMRILLAVETWKPQYADAHIIFPAFGFRGQFFGFRVSVPSFGSLVPCFGFSGVRFRVPGFGSRI